MQPMMTAIETESQTGQARLESVSPRARGPEAERDPLSTGRHRWTSVVDRVTRGVARWRGGPLHGRVHRGRDARLLHGWGGLGRSPDRVWFGPCCGEQMTDAFEFQRLLGVDWSGAKSEDEPVALAIAEATCGGSASLLVPPGGRTRKWSRGQAASRWRLGRLGGCGEQSRVWRSCA
jgi:hypothetical protein